MRIVLAPVLVLSSLLASTASAATAGATSNTVQIYQQRLSDGRIVLTDRPSPTATTERTWQVDQEDRAAARQRALDVKAEAQAVTERVQRSIDLRERMVAGEMRSRPAGYDNGYDADDDGLVGGYGYGYGYGYAGGYGRNHHRHGGRFVPPRIGAPSGRTGHFSGSASLGSR